MARQPRVLVGVDFSAGSERALEHGIALAERLGAELTLLHAWNPAPFLAEPGIAAAAPTWLSEMRSAAERRLEEWTGRAREAGVAASCLVGEGVASSVLAEASRRFDLVVLGRRGRADLAHVLLGSVCERVVRTSWCAVLIVPAGIGHGRIVPEGMLIGVDFSASSLSAFDAAKRLAAGLGARRLVLAHASPDERELWLESWSEILQKRSWPYDPAALEAWAAAAGLPPAPVEVEARVLQGHAEPALVAAAREADCDWIVLGVQGRTALAAMLIGSTTHRVLRLADRPVLTVPSQDAAPGEGSG